MIRSILNIINLHDGEADKQKVIEYVKSNITFKGANLWILACAIVIASVGLNVNSTAVIIGAMLISPLMGPIVGAGFALAIYDFELLKKSGKNLLIATSVSLLVATIYFYVSPFKDTQNELLSRTSPNIYDVLIAFFGGLVGVIAITRAEKGNPIPGVAIATALMPPLCTAGYGLAIGNYGYFLGAFYLYCINCFFICIATFFIIKYLKYKPIQVINQKYEKQIKYGITALIFIMVIPSFYLAYNLLNQKKYEHQLDTFITESFTKKGSTVIYKKTDLKASPKEIELAFLNKKFTTKEIADLNKSLIAFGLDNTNVTIKQDEIDLKSEILNEIGNQTKNISEKDIAIRNLKNELETYQFDQTNIDKEVLILFPEISSFEIGKAQLFSNNLEKKSEIVFIYQLKSDAKSFDNQKLKLWLEEKLKSNSIKILEDKPTNSKAKLN